MFLVAQKHSICEVDEVENWLRMIGTQTNPAAGSWSRNMSKSSQHQIHSIERHQLALSGRMHKRRF